MENKSPFFISSAALIAAEHASTLKDDNLIICQHQYKNDPPDNMSLFKIKLMLMVSKGHFMAIVVLHRQG